ncbi:helix-hairpin-helix domain-containing protein [Streptomyces sp. NPDC051315]|uniref:helix-hairpin-helix domain-containing protein n=1 Tax=Streptomyces sp. NPDC051315 TaxID=3365650 RepID=UPI00379D4D23
MALRSRSRTTNATSGPGRGPGSDRRIRHRRPAPRSRVRNRHASAEDLRRRAEVLFGEREEAREESGMGPPPGGGGAGAGDAVPVREEGEPRVGDRHAVPVGEAGEARGGGGTSAGGGGEPPAGGGASVVLGGESAAGVGAGVGAGTGVGVGARVGAGGPSAVGEGGSEEHVGEGGARAAWGGGDRWERAGLALRERLPVWMQARCGLERGSVLALAVVVVAVAAFAVQHFWSGRPQTVQAPEVVRAAAPYGVEERTGSAEAAATAGAPGTAGPAAPEIVVDVSGKVRKPGIHRLPAGSRVVDALNAAGGVRPGTSTDGLNRARFLVDGEQVVVGGPGGGAVSGPGVAAGPAGGSVGGAPPAPVSLNTATVEQLDTLPGVGPVLAQHIIDHRTQHGGFRSVDELREVNGIGERRFADLRNLVRP